MFHFMPSKNTTTFSLLSNWNSNSKVAACHRKVFHLNNQFFIFICSLFSSFILCCHLCCSVCSLLLSLCLCDSPRSPFWDCYAAEFYLSVYILIFGTKGILESSLCLLLPNYETSPRRTRRTLLISSLLLPTLFMQKGLSESVHCLISNWK